MTSNTLYLSRDQIREVDRIAIEDYGIPGIVLMENAARGAADVIEQTCRPGLVAILCGKGNNAGDGYAIARQLDERGWPIRIVQCSPSEHLQGDAKMNWDIAQRANYPTQIIDSSYHPKAQLEQSLSAATVILDCLLGTGATGVPRTPFDTAIRIANQCNAVRIAIDVPSGLDCDSGEPSEPCFEADHTCTFVAPKPGFSIPAAAPFLGQIHTIKIGIPSRLLREVLA